MARSYAPQAMSAISSSPSYMNRNDRIPWAAATRHILQCMNAIDATEFFTAAAMEDPWPLYARMRAIGPVCALAGTRAFFVGQHDAVEEALRRHADFSANLSGVLVCAPDGRPRLFELGGSGTASDVIATADEPEHAVQRRLLMPPLKSSRVAGMEQGIRDFARERVAHYVSRGGGDWCDAVAEALPAFVVMNLLGLPDEALESVRRWAMMGGDLLGGRIDDGQMRRLLLETNAMSAFLAAHLDQALQIPAEQRDASLTHTLCGGIESGAITREQGIGILVVLFGAAGESTASLLGCAVRLMLSIPGLQQRLRDEPVLLDNFIEEAVRLETPFKFHYRVVRHATSLCGTALEAGDRLLLGWASANRDDSAHEDADALRLDRPHPQRHLGFGHGIHFCIGAPLARLEVRVALQELLARTRHIELDPRHPPRHVPSIFIRRLQQLQLLLR
jgi:cytochrome P450 family 144